MKLVAHRTKKEIYERLTHKDFHMQKRKKNDIFRRRNVKKNTHAEKLSTFKHAQNYLLLWPVEET